jgi:D-threonine aldolase
MADTTWYVVRNAAEIPTPALLVYSERLEANIQKAIAIAGGPARLRPHVKTHKSAAIVGRMRAAGIDRFKCATVAEAEMLARCGAADVMLSYPLVGENARRFARLCAAHRGTRFSAIADGPEVARELSAAFNASAVTVAVAMDVDVGMHRTGVGWGAAAESLYGLLASLPGIVPGGLHCYDGHNHAPDPAARARLAADCHEGALSLKAALLARGLPVPLLVMGGTPGFPFHAAFPDCELSPGTCFLQDWHYQRDYPDMDFLAAALVMARVVSRPGPGRLTLDCGHKAISADKPGERGLPLNLGPARTVMQSEEHWVLECPDADRHAIGSEVYLLPAHVCPTVALHDEMRVIDAEGYGRETWPVTARGRRIGI